MTDSFIRLPEDSLGKKVRTWLLPDGTHAEALVLVDDEGNLVSSPESPALELLSSPNLAAGLTVTLETSDIATGTTGKLHMVRVASSVPVKAEIQTRQDATVITRDMVFTSHGNLTEAWTPPHPNFVTQTGGINHRFRIRITNLEVSQQADVYAAVYYDEVA